MSSDIKDGSVSMIQILTKITTLPPYVSVSAGLVFGAVAEYMKAKVR